MLASETTALDLVEAEYVREIEPGEMVVIDSGGLRSSKPFPAVRPARCVFEYVYFAKPDSVLFGSSVYETRKALGRQLAKEQPARADLVIAVPDSGVPAAIGFSQVSGIPYDVGLIRSHYVGRTFIEPQQSIRHFGVKLKLSAVREVLRGKRVVVVDDSIVRGTTSRKIVKMIKAAGASEVHLRISSPATRWPCYYGIDTPVAAGPHRRDPQHRRDRHLRHRGQPRLSLGGGPGAGRGRSWLEVVLQRLLHRELPDPARGADDGSGTGVGSNLSWRTT